MWFKSPQTRAGDTAAAFAGNNWVPAHYTSGVNMSQRLGDEDRHAVDLLLDKTATVGTTTMYAAPGNDGFEKRLNSVASILKLLGQMPAVDPPADLIARTMRRIEERAYQAPAAPVHPAVQVDPRHPA
jgi:hypothetical protein